MKVKEEHKSDALKYLNELQNGLKNIISLIENDADISNEDWQKCAVPMLYYMKIHYDSQGWNFNYPIPENI